jgi:hypothetical protein
MKIEMARLKTSKAIQSIQEVTASTLRPGISSSLFQDSRCSLRTILMSEEIYLLLSVSKSSISIHINCSDILTSPMVTLSCCKPVKASMLIKLVEESIKKAG